MLKIVYPICCGMDVHKSFVYACIASTNEQGVTTYPNLCRYRDSLRNRRGYVRVSHLKALMLLGWSYAAE